MLSSSMSGKAAKVDGVVSMRSTIRKSGCGCQKPTLALMSSTLATTAATGEVRGMKVVLVRAMRMFDRSGARLETK